MEMEFWIWPIIKVYGYRWVMLLVFMAVAAANQLLWITFASITADSTKYFGVSDLEIGLLSLSFMAVYIITAFPASWVIDTYGIRVAVGHRGGSDRSLWPAARSGGSQLYPGAGGSDRDCSRTALHPQRHHQTGGPLVSHPGTRHSLRPGQPGGLCRDRGRAGADPYLLLMSNMRAMLIGYGLFALAAALLFFCICP